MYLYICPWAMCLCWFTLLLLFCFLHFICHYIQYMRAYIHTPVFVAHTLTHTHTNSRTNTPTSSRAYSTVFVFNAHKILVHSIFLFLSVSHFFFASYLCSICNFIFLALTHLFWFDCYCRMVCMLIHIDIRVSLEIEGFDIICAASLHSHVSIAARWN